MLDESESWAFEPKIVSIYLLESKKKVIFSIRLKEFTIHTGMWMQERQLTSVQDRAKTGRREKIYHPNLIPLILITSFHWWLVTHVLFLWLLIKWKGTSCCTAGFCDFNVNNDIKFWFSNNELKDTKKTCKLAAASQSPINPPTICTIDRLIMESAKSWAPACWEWQCPTWHNCTRHNVWQPTLVFNSIYQTNESFDTLCSEYWGVVATTPGWRQNSSLTADILCDYALVPVSQARQSPHAHGIKMKHSPLKCS